MTKAGQLTKEDVNGIFLNFYKPSDFDEFGWEYFIYFHKGRVSGNDYVIKYRFVRLFGFEISSQKYASKRRVK